MIVFLQNAWSPVYAGGTWPRESWLHALKQSRSGKRLKKLIDDPRLCHNTTPIVGDSPSSKVPPDEQHILAILEEHQPSYVVACGKQAEEALRGIRDRYGEVWHLLCVPHPTARVLTNALYERAREILEVEEFSGVLALRQGRGKIVEEVLEEA